MIPWGVMNDWLRLESQQRAEHYAMVRHAREEKRRRKSVPAVGTAPERRPARPLGRDDVAACA